MYKKKPKLDQRNMSVILAIREAALMRIAVQSQPGKIVLKTLS
jgi:hypothetical protein